MSTINLHEVVSVVRNADRTFDLKLQSGKTQIVPEPVMRGVAAFIVKFRDRNAPAARLSYNGKVFTLFKDAEGNYAVNPGLFIWALKDNYSVTRKISSRDYTKFEYYFTNGTRSIPEYIDGFQTVITDVEASETCILMRIDIVHQYNCDNLMDDHAPLEREPVNISVRHTRGCVMAEGDIPINRVIVSPRNTELNGMWN